MTTEEILQTLIDAARLGSVSAKPTEWDESCFQAFDIDGLILTLEKREVERMTLGGTTMMAAPLWVVRCEVHIPSTRWQPEEIDHKEIGAFESIYTAVEEIAKCIVADRIRNATEHIVHAMAKECEEQV